MNYRFDLFFLNQFRQLVRFVQVNLAQYGWWHCLPVTAFQVIDHNDRMAALLEKISGMRADVSGAAGDEYFSQASSSVAERPKPRPIKVGAEKNCRNSHLHTILNYMALLEVRNATKSYGTDGAPVLALRGVSLDVDAGDFVALVGRSGCGKSTLLNLCGAMDFPSEGEVRIDGQVTTLLNDTELTRLRREKIGFIFQSFQLMNTLSVVENVELPLLLARKNCSPTRP